MALLAYFVTDLVTKFVELDSSAITKVEERVKSGFNQAQSVVLYHNDDLFVRAGFVFKDLNPDISRTPVESITYGFSGRPLLVPRGAGGLLEFPCSNPLRRR